MKKLILGAVAIVVTIATTTTANSAVSAASHPKTKKVCVIRYDAKIKKNINVCKTIKIHKKYTGNKVPKK